MSFPQFSIYVSLSLLLIPIEGSTIVNPPVEVAAAKELLAYLVRGFG